MDPWKASTIALIVALACVVGRGAVSSASAEPQPQMTTALNHLALAKAALETATVDKGGHRLRAIELTEDAMAQVRAVVGDDKQ